MDLLLCGASFAQVAADSSLTRGMGPESIPAREGRGLSWGPPREAGYRPPERPAPHGHGQNRATGWKAARSKRATGKFKVVACRRTLATVARQCPPGPADLRSILSEREACLARRSAGSEYGLDLSVV